MIIARISFSFPILCSDRVRTITPRSSSDFSSYGISGTSSGVIGFGVGFDDDVS